MFLVKMILEFWITKKDGRLIAHENRLCMGFTSFMARLTLKIDRFGRGDQLTP